MEGYWESQRKAFAEHHPIHHPHPIYTALYCMGLGNVSIIIHRVGHRGPGLSCESRTGEGGGFTRGLLSETTNSTAFVRDDPI